MMDPATAFQLTCGVIQLIGFGIKTAKACHEIHKSKNALTLEYENLDRETRLLRTTSTSIIDRLNALPRVHLNPEQGHLLQIAENCSQHAQTLLREIDRLKLMGVHHKRNAPVQWTKSMFRKGKIQDVQAQLAKYQKLLDTQMLSSLWYVSTSPRRLSLRDLTGGHKPRPRYAQRGTAEIATAD